MRSSNDICNIDFQKTMGGYKPSDVQEYLSEIAEDYSALQRRIADLESENAAYARQITSLKEEQISVHNLLINAQKLADKTVEDAKAEAAKIANDAQLAVSDIMNEAESRITSARQQAENIKKNSDLEMQKILSKAVVKSENMITAAHDSVARQQLLFDKLRVETASFKKELIGIYKKQLELLNSMPDEVPFDAQRAADAMAFEADKAPNYSEMAFGTTAPAQTIEENNIQEEVEPAVAEEPVPVQVETQTDLPEEKQPQEEIVDAPVTETQEEPVQETIDFDSTEKEDEIIETDEIDESAEKENKKKISFFGKLNFDEDDEDEDFEPRDLFGRKK